VFLSAVITVLCTAGITFYMRFLVALCKECNPSRIGYWVRLRLGSGDHAIAELQHRKKPMTRAALERVECGLLSNRSNLSPRLIN
jgi:hypothetical protein